MEQTSTGVGQQQASVEQSLAMTLEKFTEAFNRYDTKEVSSFWADDGTLITPGGNFGRGRSGVEKVYREDVETILEGTTSKFTIIGTRKVGSDCLFLDLDHAIQNFKKPDGFLRPLHAAPRHPGPEEGRRLAMARLPPLRLPREASAAALTTPASAAAQRVRPRLHWAAGVPGDAGARS
ncbi:MAG: nuclear transport factor 2 family protein [Myxococcales bacterium]